MCVCVNMSHFPYVLDTREKLKMAPQISGCLNLKINQKWVIKFSENTEE